MTGDTDLGIVAGSGASSNHKNFDNILFHDTHVAGNPGVAWATKLHHTTQH